MSYKFVLTFDPRILFLDLNMKAFQFSDTFLPWTKYLNATTPNDFLSYPPVHICYAISLKNILCHYLCVVT